MAIESAVPGPDDLAAQENLLARLDRMSDMILEDVPRAWRNGG